MHTKNQLAARFGRTPRTIDAWARLAGVRPIKRCKRCYFTDADVAAMMEVAGIEEATETAAIVVTPGNHQTVLAQPVTPTDLTLEHLRIGENVAFEDPLAVAQVIVATAEKAKAAMHQDIASRQMQLSATQQAVSQVNAVILDLRQEQLVYRLQTAPIDNATTQATGELQQALGELQKLRGGSDS